MILLQHSGRPVVKRVRLSGLRNFCIRCTSKRVIIGVLRSVTLLYTWYLVYAEEASLQHRSSSVLHLFMARSVPQGESESSTDGGGIVGLAGRDQRVIVTGRGARPPGSELWVSDNGATNHITSEPTKVYDWVEIAPGKENVLIGDGKGMRARGTW